MKCPRKDCRYEAIIDRQYGILPCATCQRKDSEYELSGLPEFSSVGKSHRIQRQRDKHGRDLLQPFSKGKPNAEYFKVYPEQVDKYGVRKELSK